MHGYLKIKLKKAERVFGIGDFKVKTYFKNIWRKGTALCTERYQPEYRKRRICWNEKGLTLWRKYLKDNGYIAVTEISWLTDTRHEEIENYWVDEYLEIDTIENKLSVIEKCGYTYVAHFVLDEKCWFNYYQPLLENAEEFLKKYDYADEVKEFIEECEIEADMYNRFKDYYSYVFYIAKKKAVYQTPKHL